MTYGITRQIYYYTGEHMVEIQQGGFDFSGPDMLVPAYGYGEGRDFDRPQEAAVEAIKIQKAWQADESEETVQITVRGITGGYFGIDGEPMTVGEVARWAREEWANLPKCPRCEDVMPDNEREHYTHEYADFGGYTFCSENCANLDYDDVVNYMEEEEDANYCR